MSKPKSIADEIDDAAESVRSVLHRSHEFGSLRVPDVYPVVANMAPLSRRLCEVSCLVSRQVVARQRLGGFRHDENKSIDDCVADAVEAMTRAADMFDRAVFALVVAQSQLAHLADCPGVDA